MNGQLSADSATDNRTTASSATGCFFIIIIGLFILLSRESGQCAMRACLGVAGHLSTTLRWGIPLSAFPNGTTSKSASFLHTVL